MPITTDIIRRRQARQAAARRGTQRTLRVVASFGASLATGLLLIALATAGALAGVYAYFTRDLPSAEALQAAISPDNPEFFQTTRLYDHPDPDELRGLMDAVG